MAGRRHTYRVTVTWTGNRGDETRTYAGYDQDHTISAATKPLIEGSSDPAFRGDPARWNPGELLLASISACHKLWYLGLCAVSGITVLSYQDDAEPVVLEDGDGGVRFVIVILRHRIKIGAAAGISMATRLHDDAQAKCFIANSVNFPITCEPSIDTGKGCRPVAAPALAFWQSIGQVTFRLRQLEYRWVSGGCRK